MVDDEEKNLNLDTLKLVGYFFEKSDCALRNHELKNVFNVYLKQIGKVCQQKNQHQNLIDDLTTKLKDSIGFNN